MLRPARCGGLFFKFMRLFSHLLLLFYKSINKHCFYALNYIAFEYLTQLVLWYTAVINFVPRENPIVIVLIDFASLRKISCKFNEI